MRGYGRCSIPIFGLALRPCAPPLLPSAAQDVSREGRRGANAAIPR